MVRHACLCGALEQFPHSLISLIVHDIPGLFAAIGEAVARKRDLTGAEVRFLRKRLEPSQGGWRAAFRLRSRR